MHLSDDAKAEWARISQELFHLKLLTNLDLGILAAYCESWSTWKHAVEMINRMAITDPNSKGLLWNRNGLPEPNPVVLQAQRAADAMVRYAVEFGMSPSARARLTGDFDPPPSKFDGLIGAKRR